MGLFNDPSGWFNSAGNQINNAANQIGSLIVATVNSAGDSLNAAGQYINTVPNNLGFPVGQIISAGDLAYLKSIAAQAYKATTIVAPSVAAPVVAPVVQTISATVVPLVTKPIDAVIAINPTVAKVVQGVTNPIVSDINVISTAAGAGNVIGGIAAANTGSAIVTRGAAAVAIGTGVSLIAGGGAVAGTAAASDVPLIDTTSALPVNFGTTPLGYTDLTTQAINTGVNGITYGVTGASSVTDAAILANTGGVAITAADTLVITSVPASNGAWYDGIVNWAGKTAGTIATAAVTGDVLKYVDGKINPNSAPAPVTTPTTNVPVTNTPLTGTTAALAAIGLIIFIGALK